jgi:hypothetical protein
VLPARRRPDDPAFGMVNKIWSEQDDLVKDLPLEICRPHESSTIFGQRRRRVPRPG